ncbi:actin nucleation-promoting factor WASL-like [Spea bombifrons]|uniref:actin nucleation-promoting factor WASL-like n=1 Tax=Spea bombifrons TaxID=233779 RepID=UPI002349AA2E|nr:actin nucleation-promoting factor WASL-like [Spea bombifrons]
MALFNKIGSMFQVPEARTQNVSIYYSPKEGYKGQTQKAKLKKSDIGSPSNFKHVTHVGWSSVPSLDAGSDVDLKRLFSLVGITEDHLRDRQMSRKIFEIIEKKGGMEAVRKETIRLSSVEKPSVRSRLRSLSSSQLTPSKRQSCPIVPSPCAAKMPATMTPSVLSYLPSLSRVPPPLPTPPPFIDFPAMSPLPPLPNLDYVSPSLRCASGSKSSAGYPPLPPRPNTRKRSQDVLLQTSSYSPFSSSGQKSLTGSQLPPPLPLPKKSLGNPYRLTDQDSAIDDTSAPPPLGKPFDLHKDSVICDASAPLSYGKPNDPPKEKDCTTEDMSALLPPPPPPLPFNKISSDSELSAPTSLSCDDVDTILQFKRQTQNVGARKSSMKQAKKSPLHLNEQNLFLDQIKQGVQLKSVSHTAKAESSNCSSIVTALMDVIKKRHKAIQSSEDEAEDDWDD